MACVRKQGKLDACRLRQKCLHFGAMRFLTIKTTFLWGASHHQVRVSSTDFYPSSQPAGGYNRISYLSELTQ